MTPEVRRARCEALLTAMIGKDLAERWWTSINKTFAMTPEQMYSKDPDRVYAYLMRTSEGEW